MIITIIGSLKTKNKMNECKEYFERFGHRVFSPSDGKLQNSPLVEIQSVWIKAIKEADLVVAIPKNVCAENNGATNYILTFGESTSYEMAIANDLGKKIITWY